MKHTCIIIVWQPAGPIAIVADPPPPSNPLQIKETVGPQIKPTIEIWPLYQCHKELSLTKSYNRSPMYKVKSIELSSWNPSNPLQIKETVGSQISWPLKSDLWIKLDMNIWYRKLSKVFSSTLSSFIFLSLQSFFYITTILLFLSTLFSPLCHIKRQRWCSMVVVFDCILVLVFEWFSRGWPEPSSQTSEV